MVKVDFKDGTKLWYNKTLAENLEHCKKLIRKDFDVVIIIDGEVGSGKSTLATQICKYVDPTFNVDRIAFNGADFQRIVKNTPKGRAIMFDEAMSGLHSKNAMSRRNKEIVEMMAKIRQMNFFFIMVLPSFFDLDKNIAVDRSRALIHCYTDGWKRGFFSFYGRKAKSNLYIKGKKYYSYDWRPNLYGNFGSGYGVDEEEYRRRKESDLKQYEQEKEPLNKEEVIKAYITERLEALEDNTKYTQTALSEIFGFTRKTLYSWRKEGVSFENEEES